MRCSKAGAAIALLLAGHALAAANLWFAAVRSTIPIALDAIVLTKERRPEKHRGIDDVYLLRLSGGRVLQVDEHVYDFVSEGAHVRKGAWANQLDAGAGMLDLRWSTDVYGMLWVMPMTVVTFVLLSVVRLAARGEPANQPDS